MHQTWCPREGDVPRLNEPIFFWADFASGSSLLLCFSLAQSSGLHVWAAFYHDYHCISARTACFLAASVYQCYATSHIWHLLHTLLNPKLLEISLTSYILQSMYVVRYVLWILFTDSYSSKRHAKADHLRYKGWIFCLKYLTLCFMESFLYRY